MCSVAQLYIFLVPSRGKKQKNTNIGALQEIWEETTLKPPSIQLIRPGRPLPIHDSDEHFIVHPFLFHINTSKEPSVELNWENLSHKWLSAIPQTFSTLQTVPKLSETLARIYFLGKEKETLDFLRDDRSHGASQLAEIVLGYLSNWKGSDGIFEKNKIEQFLNYAWELIHIRPSMVAIANAVYKVLDGMLEGSLPHENEKKQNEMDGKSCLFVDKLLGMLKFVGLGVVMCVPGLQKYTCFSFSRRLVLLGMAEFDASLQAHPKGSWLTRCASVFLEFVCFLMCSGSKKNRKRFKLFTKTQPFPPPINL